MLSAVIYSARSYPAVPLARQPVHQRCVLSGPLVLGKSPLKSRTPTADRDRTVSRGAKRSRRYGLLGIISLLSPAYLLSVERWPFHAGPPDHYDRLSSLLGLSALQSGKLVPLHSTADFRPA